MYLQITTKCNMSCAHCGFSCNKNGKHMPWNTFVDAITFARNINDETITIGGGEPTLHPRFFDILKICYDDFNYIWMATNGSKTNTMFRLYDILTDQDYNESGEKGFFEYDVHQEGKLVVALSQDWYHDSINSKIVDLWNLNVKNKVPGFEIRNVTLYDHVKNIAAQGRAKKYGYINDHCVCPDLIIKPDGKLKLCGCTRSPTIGNIWSGIEDYWLDIIENNEGYIDSSCYKKITETEEI